jgi:energy-coupling factor transporter ATP-binding protein EcfA2
MTEPPRTLSFPVFRNLSVDGYGLYPGIKSKPGLDIDFAPGLTLVLGANGLGKTTLVSMLFRLCTGPFDIPGLAGATELGTRNLRARRLRKPDSRMFAGRVMDNAESANATLTMTVGASEIEVTRTLSSLELIRLVVDGAEQVAEESDFQDLMLDRAGLTSFGDWILLLRHLTFYFEDRRALVWDPSAQRQILRFLFLDTATGQEWARQEREIVEQDSRMRNLQAALTREERALAESEEAIADDELRDELTLLEKLLAVDEEKLAEVTERLADAETDREAARLEFVKSDTHHESAFRKLERLQLQVIATAFPSGGDTARYLLGMLFREGTCLACGASAQQAAAELKRRVAKGQCTICGSELNGEEVVSFSSRAIAQAENRLHEARQHLDASTDARATTEHDFDSVLLEAQEAQTKASARRARFRSLLQRLPADERDLREQRDELAGLRRSVETMKANLEEQRTTFAAFIKRVNRDVITRRDEIQTTFAKLARGFLLEKCHLRWSTHKARLGETGRLIEFPAFELELGGAGFPSPVRRAGPNQVSESQREFIDLAFRMTLMEVAGRGTGGSLVIDAPESSLDAVFVRRAAEVLTRFGNPRSSNRLIITSNLIEGDLIPQLISKSGITGPRDSRVVDLLRVAAPTAATKSLHSEYVAVRKRLFQQGTRRDK